MDRVFFYIAAAVVAFATVAVVVLAAPPAMDAAAHLSRNVACGHGAAWAHCMTDAAAADSAALRSAEMVQIAAAAVGFVLSGGLALAGYKTGHRRSN